MKRFFIMLLAVLCMSTAWAQYADWRQILQENSDLTFAELVEKIDAFYVGKSTGKGSGYKQYQRWKFEKRRQLDATGHIKNSSGAALAEIVKQQDESADAKSGTSGAWRSVGPTTFTWGGNGRNPGIGRVNRVVRDPSNVNTIYIGTPAGGLWRSTDNGGSWTPLTDGLGSLGISGIAINPNNRNQIFILTGDGDGSVHESIGVLVSNDFGQTWNTTGLTWTTNQQFYGYHLRMDPNNSNRLYACTTNGLWVTTDGGVNWIQRLTGTISDIEFHPTNSAQVYVSTTGGQFLRSTNRGVNWTNITSGLPTGGGRVAIGVTADRPNAVYALFGGGAPNGTFQGLYLSTDGGVNFNTQSTTPNIMSAFLPGTDNGTQGWYDLSIAVDPTDDRNVIVGGVNIWSSTDRGQTWSNNSYWDITALAGNQYVHADIHDLAFYGNTLYAGCDGGVFNTTNLGTNWTDLSAGLQITQIYSLATDPTNFNRFFFGTQDNGSNIFNGVENRHVVDIDGGFCLIDPSNSQIMYANTQNSGWSATSPSRLLRTTDGGNSWNAIQVSTTGGVNAGNGQFVTPFAMDPNTNTNLVAGFQDVWRTTNSGTSWTNLSNGNVGNGLADFVAIAPSNSSVIGVSKGRRFWVRRFNPTTFRFNWLRRDPPGGANSIISQFAFDPANSNIIWVAETGYNNNRKVYRTTDGGTNWTNFSAGLPNVPIHSILVDPWAGNNAVYVGTEIGVYFRNDDLGQFVWYNWGMPNTAVYDLEIDASTNYLVAATFGRGIFNGDLYDDRNLNCPLNVNLTDNAWMFSNPLFQAGNQITSNRRHASSSVIGYEAGNRVVLRDGFRVNRGAYFYASMVPCTSILAPKEGVPPVSGVYAGPMEGLNSFASAEFNGSGLSLFPNPTAGFTTLDYEISSPADVEIEVWDVSGRKLKTLMESTYLGEGAYSLNFSLDEYARGLYQVVIRKGEQMEMGKLLLTE